MFDLLKCNCICIQRKSLIFLGLMALFLLSCKDNHDQFFDKTSIRGLQLKSSVNEAEIQKNTKFELHGYEDESFKLLTYTSKNEVWKVDDLQMIDIFYKFYKDKLSSVLFVFPWIDAQLMIANVEKRIGKFSEYKENYKINHNGIDYEIEAKDGIYIAEVGDNVLLIMSKDDIYGKLTIADKADFFEISNEETKIEANTPKGFRGIPWGQDLYAIKNDLYDVLNIYKEGDRYKSFKKKNEYSRFGAAYVRSIEYNFWDNKFYAVRIVIDKTFINDFKKAFTKEYGDIIRGTKTGEFITRMRDVEVYCRYALNDKNIFIFTMTYIPIENEKKNAERIEAHYKEIEKENLPTGF